MTTGDDSTVPQFADMLRLDGRSFVVVGAGVGIGRQTTHAISQLGGQVLCVDIDGDRAGEIADEVGGTPFVADARDRAGAEGIIAAAQAAFGRVDGLVDIVGMARFVPLLETPEEDWDWTLGMCVRHAYHLVQAAGRAMAEHGGTMVFVASIDGIVSAPFHAAYGVAKAGLLNLVRTASVELGPMAIRVNAVAPGPTKTPRIMARSSGAMAASPATGGTLYIPLGEVNETWDIASSILFLSSGLSRHVNGHCIVVDGGAINLMYDIEKLRPA
jgi:NAD(P)-dependent dehydrogenase (short-subunit alcohol dehydrogenase family)